MMYLSPDIKLLRIPCLKLNIDSNCQIRISIEGKTFIFGSHTLALLDAFSQPHSISEVLENMQTRVKGIQDWMDLVTTIIHLHEAGVLQDEAKINPLLKTDSSGYDSAPIHAAMLNDRGRTSSFLAGIYEVVHPGDVVIDIGTGTGVLAIAAARAGARHVYAVEASSIGKLAKAIFEANKLADRITLIEGWSTHINLPELGDVVISEMIGNEPLAENVLEITADATKRLLKPEGRLIPNKVKILGLPVSIPNTELMKYTFITNTLENWQSWYGIDFNPLGKVIQNFPHTFFINSFVARDWKTLSEPTLLAEINLKDFNKMVIDNMATVTSNASGQLNGLLEYFELELSPTTSISTHPAKVDINNHWRSPVWVLNPPLLVDTGDQFTVTYQYRQTEDRTKVSVSRL